MSVRLDNLLIVWVINRQQLPSFDVGTLPSVERTLIVERSTSRVVAGC